jgi:hypothetical protein
MKKILLFLLVSTAIFAQEPANLFKLSSSIISPGSSWSFSIPTGQTLDWNSVPYLRVNGGQIQYWNGVTWTAIPAAVSGTLSWTHGVTKIYQTTVGDKVYIRTSATDTTQTGLFNVAGLSILKALKIGYNGSQLDSGKVVTNQLKFYYNGNSYNALMDTAIAHHQTAYAIANGLYTWAKAATKPSYAYTEITSTPNLRDSTNWNTAYTLSKLLAKDSTNWNTAYTQSHLMVKDTTNWNTSYTRSGKLVADSTKWNLSATQAGLMVKDTIKWNLASTQAGLMVRDTTKWNAAAPLASPTFTGTATSPRIVAGTGITSGIPFTVTNKLGTTKATIDSLGILKYYFVHYAGSADSIAIDPGITVQSQYKKIVAGIAMHDSIGFIYTGDSIKVKYAGDYTIFIAFGATAANAGDTYRIKIYKNGLPFPVSGSSSIGRFLFRVPANNYANQASFQWYIKSASANDVWSFRVCNESASRSLTINDMKIIIQKMPE